MPRIGLTSSGVFCHHDLVAHRGSLEDHPAAGAALPCLISNARAAGVCQRLVVTSPTSTPPPFISSGSDSMGPPTKTLLRCG